MLGKDGSSTQLPLRKIWLLTGFVAIGLLLATIALAIKAKKSDNVEIAGYVVGSGHSIYLRAQPSNESRIVTILERDRVVRITNTRTLDEQTWYYVTSETEKGWILAENISFDPP